MPLPPFPPEAFVASPDPVLAAPSRLAWLERSGLGTPGDPRADRVVRLVKRVLGVPTAFVSAVTDRAQVLHGAPDLPAQAPLSHAYCRTVVQTDAPFVVDDAPADALVCDHPATAAFGIGAYVGVPFRAPDGTPLGALGAVSPTPRAWTVEDVDVLRDLARLFEAELALAAPVEALRPEAVVSHGALTDDVVALVRALSHDLAEPLRKVRTYASLLRPALADAEGFRALGALEANASLVHERLRDAARYGALRLRPFAPATVDLATVVAPLVRRVERAEATFAHGPLPVVAGDAVLLARLVEVLVGNALRFRRADAPLALRLDAAREADGEGRAWHVLTFSDTGRGFDARHAERMFRPFERLHADVSGTGLGLPLARAIARAHGGDLTATGTPGEGARVTLRLPAAPV